MLINRAVQENYHIRRRGIRPGRRGVPARQGENCRHYCDYDDDGYGGCNEKRTRDDISKRHILPYTGRPASQSPQPRRLYPPCNFLALVTKCYIQPECWPAIDDNTLVFETSIQDFAVLPQIDRWNLSYNQRPEPVVASDDPSRSIFGRAGQHLRGNKKIGPTEHPPGEQPTQQLHFRH